MADPHDMPLFDGSLSWEESQAALEGAELGDGLPLVPPTLDRMSAMLAGHGSPDQSFGNVMPLMGELTLKAVAYNCVMAGCRPEELPVVLSAVEACNEPQFNLLGVLSTTGTPAVAVCVHGPAVQQLGLNAGGNCLGPGNRVNASIGRAVSLVLRNIGGARAGVADMATMGQPGKYGFCFAEGTHPGFPSLHVRRGLAGDDSAVTVLGVSGTDEVLPASPQDTPELVLQPVAAAMNAAIDASSATRKPERGEQIFLLPPEMADIIANAGWDLARLQAYLQAARHPYPFEGVGDLDDRPLARAPEDIHPIITGGVGIKMSYLPLWSGGSETVTRKVRVLQG
ncbi:MAG: hypothetical protein OXT06_03475 [Rhodospirillaceae bacterium]|nr:hypothetical protein [Rhodospirillaceae bacterium]MDD9918356.1 hypothetical protein [Rhodospirillaceae bacterium]MDD9928241.1 hypothetical protein [Rhodospirillaceae bacterium]